MKRVSRTLPGPLVAELHLRLRRSEVVRDDDRAGVESEDVVLFHELVHEDGGLRTAAGTPPAIHIVGKLCGELEVIAQQSNDVGEPFLAIAPIDVLQQCSRIHRVNIFQDRATEDD